MLSTYLIAQENFLSIVGCQPSFAWYSYCKYELRKGNAVHSNKYLQQSFHPKVT